MRIVYRFCGVLLLCLMLGAAVTSAQISSVTVEAIQQANVRRATSIDAEILGAITPGTRYPVIGRSALYPWVLIADPTSGQPFGWVFRDVVTIQGDLNTVPVNENPVNAAANAPLATATLPAAGATGTSMAPALNATATLPATQAPVGSVIGTVLNEINVRYGPGIEYERIGVGFAGDTFQIVAYHTQMPWVQVVYPASPTGFGWINVDLLDVTGDLNSVNAVTQTSFNFPTLTPTASPVEFLNEDIIPISAEFRALGNSIWERMQTAGFDPATSRMGGFYLKNLQTGEALALGDGIAFSGMSLTKIAILTALYGDMDRPPDDATAVMIAEAMICSENISTNEMLAILGDGNPYTGANRVSEFLQRIGLQRTFIFTPYDNDPFITPQAPLSRTTDADQRAAQPDPFNQITVSELGGLLDSVYQCGYGTTSPLLAATDGAFTPDECRQILNTMSYNKMGNFIEAGTAEGVRLAHKHGWIDDTHGDAGLVFSPGGDYVFVMVLHSPDYLEFGITEPLVEESARDVYNYFNPDAPLAAVRPPDVDGVCNLMSSPAIGEMQQLEFSG